MPSVWTPRYISAIAGGGGAGTEVDPWTLDEWWANAVAGDYGWIKADGTYTCSANKTPTNAGAYTTGLIAMEGYKTTIGDGYQGRLLSGVGLLDTTNFPILNFDAGYVFTPKAHWLFRCLRFTGSVTSNYLIPGNAANTYTDWEHCSFTNNGSGAGAWGQCLRQSVAFNCDYSTPNDTTGGGVYMNTSAIIECHFKSCGNYGAYLLTSYEHVATCVFHSPITDAAVYFYTDRNYNGTVYKCSFANLSAAAIQHGTNRDNYGLHYIFRNHATGCNYFFDNGPYGGLAVMSMNRTRDNTNADTSKAICTVGANAKEAITTDTGGDETDYVDAANDDLALIVTAPGAFPSGHPHNTGAGAIRPKDLDDIPDVASVLDQDTVQGTTGELTLPADGSKILTTEGTFGAGGTSITPSWTKADKTKVLTGNNFGDGGTSEVASYSPDFPDTDNVTDDDTVDGTAGNFTNIAEAYVVSGSSWGAGGTEFNGSYTGTAAVPTAGTITITDGANGSTVTYSFLGGSNTSDYEGFYQAMGGTGWTSAGTRSGTGDLVANVTPGMYHAYGKVFEAGGTNITPVIDFQATGGTESQHELILASCVGMIDAGSLSDANGTSISGTAMYDAEFTNQNTAKVPVWAEQVAPQARPSKINERTFEISMVLCQRVKTAAAQTHNLKEAQDLEDLFIGKNLSGINWAWIEEFQPAEAVHFDETGQLMYSRVGLTVKTRSQRS